MNCTHQFVPTHDEDAIEHLDDGKHQLGVAVIIVCAFCGAVRRIYPSGTVEILKDHGDIIKRQA